MVRRTFSREFKLDAIKLMRECGGAGVARLGRSRERAAEVGEGLYGRFAAGVFGTGEDEAGAAYGYRARSGS